MEQQRFDVVAYCFFSQLLLLALGLGGGKLFMLEIVIYGTDKVLAAVFPLILCPLGTNLPHIQQAVW